MAFSSKYGVARHIYIAIPKAGSANHAVGADWTPAAGDVKISKDGGAAANVTNLPTAIAMGNSAIWDFSLTATELQAAQIVVTVADSATKAVDDTGFEIETYGNASAQHAVDFDDSVRLGLTALPNAAADAAGGLPISDAGGLDLDAKIGALTYGTANRVNVQVYGMENNTITASVIATDAIDNDAIAASAVTEIQSGLATAASISALNNLSSAQAQTAAEAALVTHRLDELLNADSDIDGAAPPTVGSVFHELMTKTAGSFTYDQTTDSLEAVRDRGDAAWITATGFATSAALATAQADLDILTGADGVTLATLQPNYAPATAAALASLVTTVGVAGAGLTDLGGMSTTMKAQVNTEADTALSDVGVTLARMGALTDWIDGGRLDLLLDGVVADHPNRPTRGVALADVMFMMVDATDLSTPETGVTVTATISKDGGAFAACANAVSEVSGGWYKIALSSGEMTADSVALKFTGTGCAQRNIAFRTQPT